MYLTPHTNSAMAMFGFVYLWYLMAVLVMEIWLEYRADIVRYAQESTGWRRILYRAMTLGSYRVGMGCVDIDTKTAMHDARGTTPRLLAPHEATCDGAKAIHAGFKGKFYAINLLLDITPDCHCFDRSDLPAVPDLGILGSDDPVAVDKASYDLIIAARVIRDPGLKAPRA